MRCTRGKATPNEPTKQRLFADSGGFCQNPNCLSPLFLDIDDTLIQVAEIAHIFAAMDEGPRANKALSQAERGAYANLILLCPRCHTIVDKAPDKFPDSCIRAWKLSHRERIAAAFGAVKYDTRGGARDAIEPLLLQNLEIHRAYGPDSEYRYDPESELADSWRRKVRAFILPNNRKLLAILEANRCHLNDRERAIMEQFRQHIDDMEARHIGIGVRSVSSRFPVGVNDLLRETFSEYDRED